MSSMVSLLMNDAVAYIAPRRRFDGFVFDTAGALRCLALAAGVRVEPLDPAWPPASFVLRSLVEPGVRFLGIRLANPMTAAILGRGIDHAGDMAARAEHERLVI